MAFTYRTVHELNQTELEELRGNYFSQLEDTDPDVLGDISTAEEIPMSDIISHYDGTSFVEDDFFCNQTGKQRREELMEKHEELRAILIKYGNEEFGDCIVDEICALFEFPTTIEYYEE